MGSSPSIRINEDGVFVKAQDQTLTMNQDGIFVNTPDKTLTVTQDGVRVNGEHVKWQNNTIVNNTSVKTINNTTTVCKNNKCITFECDKVRMRKNQVYCRDVLYYQFVEDHFKDARS